LPPALPVNPLPVNPPPAGVLVRTVGLFGFQLTFTSGEAYVVLVIEAVAIVLLGLTARRMLTDRRS
jgi:hypothetical protein